MTTINRPKFSQGLTQWALVPLGDPWCPLDQILYTTPKKGTVFCEVYISMLVDLSLYHPYYSTDKDNSNNNELEELT